MRLLIKSLKYLQYCPCCRRFQVLYFHRCVKTKERYMKKITLFIPSIIFTVLTLISIPVQANTSVMAAQYLTDLGKSYYDAGQEDEAVHEFSKALLVDPHNIEAISYLHKMGFNQGLYPGLKTGLTEKMAKVESVQVDQLALASQAKDLEIAVLKNKLTSAEDSAAKEEEGKKLAELEKQEALISQQLELLKNQKNLLATIDELSNSLEFLDQDISKLKDQSMDAKYNKEQLSDIEVKLNEVQGRISQLKQE